MCKIAILEDYSLFCSGILPVLDKIKALDVVVQARHIKDFISAYNGSKPDVIIVDVIHCEDNGIQALKKIRSKTSKTPILLVLNKNYAAYFDQYIALGVNGIVCSSFGPEQLIEAVKTLKDGAEYFPPKVWMLLKEHLRAKRIDILPDTQTKNILTNREMDILRLFCKGYTYKEVAHHLNISPRTVETHKKNITSKINVRSTAEMVEFAVHNQLT